MDAHVQGPKKKCCIFFFFFFLWVVWLGAKSMTQAKV